MENRREKHAILLREGGILEAGGTELYKKCFGENGLNGIEERAIYTGWATRQSLYSLLGHYLALEAPLDPHSGSLERRPLGRWLL